MEVATKSATPTITTSSKHCHHQLVSRQAENLNLCNTPLKPSKSLKLAAPNNNPLLFGPLRIGSGRGSSWVARRNWLAGWLPALLCGHISSGCDRVDELWRGVGGWGVEGGWLWWLGHDGGKRERRAEWQGVSLLINKEREAWWWIRKLGILGIF